MKKIQLPFFIIGLFTLTLITYFLARESLQKINITSVFNYEPTSTPSSSPLMVLGIRTKTMDCIVQNSLPDKECTPGAVFSHITKDEVCTSGYSSNVRNVSIKTKDAVYREYGIISHEPGEYEVDHLISLELGGSNDIANLWPESADPRPGYHEKDKVENYLHDEVCSGRMNLQEAQSKIANDWLEVYKEIDQ
jgi:hypothetical protein